jgi:dUTP pyrophosphatase
MQVGVKAIRDGVKLPEYGTERSACADLRASLGDPGSVKVLDENNDASLLQGFLGLVRPWLPGLVKKHADDLIVIPPRGRALIPTGLVFDIPEGYSLRVHPRSGLSFKLGMTVVCGEGVIDEDYQNELFVPIINLSDEYAEIKNGDRIAQIELVKDERCSFSFVDTLSDKHSSRNGGFGHTGTA